MVKVIIGCADLHIRSLKRLEETYTMLSNFIEQVKNDIKDYNKDEVRIVIAGDVFNDWIHVSNEAKLAAAWFIRNISEVAKTIVIAGNHDYTNSNIERVDSLTPIFEIADFKNAIYLDRELEYQSGVYEDDNINWCLYCTFDKFNKPTYHKTNGKHLIGLIHGEVNGARDDSNYLATRGLDKSSFKGLDFVIAGHIHKFQELKYGKTKIVYCSSLIQQGFGENIDNHGYIIYDVEGNDYTFKELPNEDYGYYHFVINNVNDILENKEELINVAKSEE